MKKPMEVGDPGIRRAWELLGLPFFLFRSRPLAGDRPRPAIGRSIINRTGLFVPAMAGRRRATVDVPGRLTGPVIWVLHRHRLRACRHFLDVLSLGDETDGRAGSYLKIIDRPTTAWLDLGFR